MKAFAILLDRLSFSPQRNVKLRLLEGYLRNAPDPERGWALASLTGELVFDDAKPAMIRKAVEARLDPVLFALSYDFVGDLAETAALAWPSKHGANVEPELPEVIDTLRRASRREVPQLLERWLDALDADGRWALLKLLTGGLRVGVSARLAKQALANLGGVEVAEIEELGTARDRLTKTSSPGWRGRGEKPSADAPARSARSMLAQAIDEERGFSQARSRRLRGGVEMGWHPGPGGRTNQGQRLLHSRTGDDIGKSFPDVLAALEVRRRAGRRTSWSCATGISVAFGELQQRLNRKTAFARTDGRNLPAGIRAYDLLLEGEEDIPPSSVRGTPQAAGDVVANLPLQPTLICRRFSRSGIGTNCGLAARQAASRATRRRCRRPDAQALGFPSMRRGVARRAPGSNGSAISNPLGNAVLMYAQRGHGKRSGFYSDYIFRVWRESENGGHAGDPCGQGLFRLHRHQGSRFKPDQNSVRDNTVERFGPVRSLRAEREFGLVLEIAFEGLQRLPPATNPGWRCGFPASTASAGG